MDNNDVPGGNDPAQLLRHVNQNHAAVLMIRLEHLKLAIQRREWDQVEFQYDRVLRATTKWREAV